MVACKKCGHEMSDTWANMVNQCPICAEEVYKQPQANREAGGETNVSAYFVPV